MLGFLMTTLQPMNPCLHCGVLTANPKYYSRSHAAIHTNRAAPKRKPQGACVVC